MLQTFFFSTPCVGTTGKWYRCHTPTKACPKALGLLVITDRTSSSEVDASTVWEREVDTVKALRPSAPCNLNCDKCFHFWAIDIPYPRGIWARLSRVKTVISPRLYIQATTAGLLQTLLNSKLVSTWTLLVLILNKGENGKHCTKDNKATDSFVGYKYD